jgi:hypothetical protein
MGHYCRWDEERLRVKVNSGGCGNVQRICVVGIWGCENMGYIHIGCKCGM